MGPVRRTIARALGIAAPEPKDAITELEDAIVRAVGIAKYQPKVRAMCVDTIAVIDELGKFDRALNDECPETQRNV